MISEFVREKKIYSDGLIESIYRKFYIGIYAHNVAYIPIFVPKKFLNFLKFKSKVLCTYNILYCICDKN